MSCKLEPATISVHTNETVMGDEERKRAKNPLVEEDTSTQGSQR